MKGVQLWPVDQRGLIAHEHLAAIIEGIDHHRAGVAETDLEDGMSVSVHNGQRRAKYGGVASRFTVSTILRTQ